MEEAYCYGKKIIAMIDYLPNSEIVVFRCEGAKWNYVAMTKDIVIYEDKDERKN